ncbi:hypothetical protein [Pseudanabaena sp. 'Roaring Creek']|uniref:hypothetical protein n=1 Tax=Pseudanabaena sp. 'Roaring Creek' TaxID=1681830 RepID=UPI0006D7DB57|nr:hypothetical protein [Pseudanabaena sp. 'Roaring Creek']
MGQTTYRNRYSIAIAGMVDGLGDGQGEPYLNDGGFVAESWTITTPTTPADNTLYSIAVTDRYHPNPPIVASFTTSIGTSRADLAAGLYASARNNMMFTGLLLVVNNTSTIVLTHRQTNIPFFPVVSGGGAAPLTVPTTPTTPASAPMLIGFGLGVTRIAGGSTSVRGNKSARLPIAGDTANYIAGFTIATRNSQKDRVGEGALVGYEPGGLAMNVLQRCANLPGIWVPTLETSINPDADSVYLSVLSGSQGYVQKTNANSAIDISPKGRFRSFITTSVNGQNLVLVQADF